MKRYITRTLSQALDIVDNHARDGDTVVVPDRNLALQVESHVIGCDLEITVEVDAKLK